MALKLMGTKEGMTKVFDDKGNLIVCTVISIKPNVVVQVKTEEKDGYRGVQLGAGRVAEAKKQRVAKPQRGHFAAAKVEPMRELFESWLDGEEEMTPGQEVAIDYFADAPYVDVTGTSKGKGFQGVIKRHNFAGGPTSQGSS